MAEVPWIGSAIQKNLVVEVEYGHHTLTRFFALHAEYFLGHAYRSGGDPYLLFRKHGIHVKEPRPKKDSYFWPDQILKDAIACLAILLAVVGLTLYFRGAPLGPPADPANEFPRPAGMVFPFLFNCSNMCLLSGSCNYSFVPCIMDILQPFIGASRPGHQLNIGFWWTLIAGLWLLTLLAFFGRSSKSSSCCCT